MPRYFLLCATALAFSAACGAKAPGKHPNVVLILVDQLRADAADTWMPKTKALSDRGVRFEEMRAVAPWTYPSVISMVSGLYPQQHGADGHMNGKVMSTFSKSVPLLPRFLHDAGYHTAGFITNPFLHEWNPFHEAFDEYQSSEFINSQGNNRGHGNTVWTDRMWSDTVNPAVLEHFSNREYTTPEFTYVHYIDVHGRRAGDVRWDSAPFSGSYRAACEYVDERIIELYEFFHARYRGDLIFLVTSDHGENFEDDELVGYGKRFRQKKATVHDFNLRIPCYVLPGRSVPNRVVKGPTANLDITPTLLEWTGLDVPDVLSGMSLLKAVEGAPYDGTERPIYARMSAMGRHNDCLILDGKKYLRHFDPRTGKVGARHTFDLELDRRETTDLGPNFQPHEARFEEAAGDRGYALPATFENPGESLLKALDELGYGGGEDGG
ncbi:MAG: hypothetical protein CMJ89_02475 [Planctomycetes bacterium]|jgi:arylsulfatase A-like enzyme|nr:hypothetical protein [Planctomycetota bacterium]